MNINELKAGDSISVRNLGNHNLGFTVDRGQFIGLTYGGSYIKYITAYGLVAEHSLDDVAVAMAA